jgi:hypothetical protein
MPQKILLFCLNKFIFFEVVDDEKKALETEEK